MVHIDELDFCAAEIGEPRGRGERKTLQLGMPGIDDLCSKLDGILGGRAGAGGVAGERIDDPDLDRIGGTRRERGRCGKLCGRQDAECFHGILPVRQQHCHAAFCGHLSRWRIARQPPRHRRRSNRIRQRAFLRSLACGRSTAGVRRGAGLPRAAEWSP